MFRRLKWVALVLLAVIVVGLLEVANECRANMITRIGEYYLGQDIKTARGLVEMAPEESAVLRSYPGWFDMPDERLFKAKITFNRHDWDLIVGAVNERIYIFALQYFSSDRVAAANVLKDALRFVRSQMGAPTEQTKTPERNVWDSMDGSVILVERGVMGFWSINFVVTGKHPRP